MSELGLTRPTLLSENVWIVLKQNLSYQVNKLSMGLLLGINASIKNML
jgi:hypothetical protein